MNSNFHCLAFATLTLLASTSASAIVGGSVDDNAINSAWAGVGAVTINGAVYTGALIDNQHVLTAAHIVAGQQATPGNVSFTLNIGGNSTEVLNATAINVYPGYTGTTPGTDGVWHDDLAIIKLSAPVASTVAAYALHGGRLGGKIITLVGYGGGGDGINGVTVGSNANVKRTGQNRVDVLLEDDDGGALNEVLVFDFDGPTTDSNVYGSNQKPSNLTLGASVEAQFAGGDSGGPIIVKIKGVWKIAGVAAFVGGTPQSAGSNAKFGSIGGGTILAPYLSWIYSIIGQ